MNFPAPPDERSRLVLQAVWDLLLTDDRWPTFGAVDRRLDRQHDLQIDEVVPALPADLLLGYSPRVTSMPSEDQELSLTLAGAVACTQSAEVTGLFVAAVRLAADIEREHPSESEGGRPGIDCEMLTRQVPMPAAGRHQLLASVGALLRAESWGWTAAGGSPDWHFSFDRRVRRYRDVRDEHDYWARRQHSATANSSQRDMFWGLPVVDLTGDAVLPQVGILHPAIEAVVAPRLRAGLGDNAVEEACKVLAQRLRDLTGLHADSVQLVNQALGTGGAVRLADVSTEQGRSEQDGYADLMRGLFRVGRNLRAHRPSSDEFDRAEVDRLLALASLCLTRLDGLRSPDAGVETARDISPA